MIITTNTSCPIDHPHEVLYELFPGSRIGCDCIDRAPGRWYPDTKCKKGKNKPHNGADCWEQKPMGPVV